MQDSLGDVGAESEAEENGEKVCGRKTGTKGPLGCLRILESWQPFSG